MIISKPKHCLGCEELIENDYDSSEEYPYIYHLCEECNSRYDNKTGYCSLSCSLGFGCDESC